MKKLIIDGLVWLESETHQEINLYLTYKVKELRHGEQKLTIKIPERVLTLH